jgi:hypothetical protein
MFSRVLFAALLTWSTAVSAQNLTNAEVYDFAIGDVYYTVDNWHGYGNNASPLYVRDSVMDAQANMGGYEMLYTFTTQRFRGPMGPFDAEDTTYIYTFGYVDGSAVPEHYVDPWVSWGYVPDLDTLAPNDLLCGRIEWRRHYAPCDTCEIPGPPTPWDSYFVSGCGGPFYLNPENFWGDIFESHELIYYRKDGEECGTDIPMGISSWPEAERLIIFPDPVEQLLSWTGIPAMGRIRILAMNGSSVMDAPAATRMDVSVLDPGAYLFVLIDPQGVTHRARFIKR